MGVQDKKSDGELRRLALVFVDLFQKSAASENVDAQSRKRVGFSVAYGSFVAVDEDVSDALWSFVLRSAQLLGPAAAHERAMYQTALKEAQRCLADSTISIESCAQSVIDVVFTEGAKRISLLAPNYLFRFVDGVKEISIGRVKAGLTSGFLDQWKTKHSFDKLNVCVGDSYKFIDGADGVFLTLPQICWQVNVDAVSDNAAEESKWLIDIAISILRLSYSNWSGYFPHRRLKEPHPMRPTIPYDDGVIFCDSNVSAGTFLPCWYQIDAGVEQLCAEQKFRETVEIVMDPPPKSVAERTSQALGWLARGRQAEDRAERLLHFFTAIEALLSSDDKTAPVVQTIARHAAVMLAADNAERAQVANRIKSLYNVRSALVHAGRRSVLQSMAELTQSIAEEICLSVLNEVDLSRAHKSFNEQLGVASYGLPWPVTDRD